MSEGAADKAKAASQNSPNTLEHRIGILRSRFAFVAPFLWTVLFKSSGRPRGICASAALDPAIVMGHENGVFFIPLRPPRAKPHSAATLCAADTPRAFTTTLIASSTRSLA